jgi:hypothetical protein
MTDLHCDRCDRAIQYNERRIVAKPRPSDPTELVALSFLCEKCGFDLPTAEQIWNLFEQGGYPNILFVSI